jgi:carbon storage regulator
MLVLTRRPGEWITIGDDVTVKVLSVRGDQIQLGIEAPREIRVDRGEIREQILAATEDARRSAVDPGGLVRLLSDPSLTPGRGAAGESMPVSGKKKSRSD